MSVEAQTNNQEPVVKAVIRQYEPSDREAVREISCVTAFRNLGAQSIFEHAEDRELFADYWSRYYTDFEPESVWVAEQAGTVVGYLFGCVDSSRFVRTMARRIVPKIVVRLLWRFVLGKYRQGRSRLFVKWLLLKSWREAPALPLKTYPAHFHCNILLEGYNQNHAHERPVAGAEDEGDLPPALKKLFQDAPGLDTVHLGKADRSRAGRARGREPPAGRPGHGPAQRRKPARGASF